VLNSIASDARGHGPIEEWSVLLTADCNLRCAYCYQNARRAGTVEWPALQAALDLLLASPSPRRVVSFTGGEPAQGFESIVRAVGHALRGRSAGTAIGFHLVTNGLLLGRPEVAFLASHDFTLDLSFDGVAAAQDQRGRGTFARLDALLDLLRAEHHDYFSRRVTVSTTVARGTIPHLAESFAYFLSKGVTAVSIHPATGQTEWAHADLELLDARLSEIARVSVERHRATGTIPFTVFRRRGTRDRGIARAWGCSAPAGRALALDVDGQVYPCAVLARSYQSFPPGIDGRMQMLSLGSVHDPALAHRLAALPDACRASGLFAPKRLQHSGERRCSSCRERAHCVVCPLARVTGRTTDDLNDIPRYLCAYERILGKQRRRFLAQAPRSRGEALLMRILREQGAHHVTRA
jgi:sulfatase maturation enzyme AslB (radical SAM superfamily)